MNYGELQDLVKSLQKKLKLKLKKSGCETKDEDSDSSDSSNNAVLETRAYAKGLIII